MLVFAGVSGNILVGSGYTKTNLLCELITVITNVLLNFLLIPLYGIIGAAIGTSTSFIIRNIAYIIAVYKVKKMQPFKKNYILITLSGVIVYILFYLIKTKIYSYSGNLIEMIVTGIFLLGFYMVLILFFRCLDSNDKFILKLIMKRLGLHIKFIERLIK
jgi:O-antigen/teichoic acid export membrane protein